MSFLRLILASLAYHRRSNLAIGLGVAVATAVLTGALLVGDSVRGSLRHLALDRLGRIDEVLVIDRFFRAKLADELTAEKLPRDYNAIVPAILLRGTVSRPDTGATAGGVGIFGCDQRFWALDAHEPHVPELSLGEVLVNQTLADKLQVKVGDDVIVRLPTPSHVPRESLLGRKTETVTNRRLRVRGIVPAEGLGRFALEPSQQLVSNVFLSLAELQDILDQPDRVNALLVGGDLTAVPSEADHRELQAALHPKLTDYGLRAELTDRKYYNLTSSRMMLDPEAVGPVAMRKLAIDRPQPVFTYLANTIACGKKSIPYSTVAAIDFSSAPPLGPFRTPEGNTISTLSDDEIVLNTWAAERLDAKLGDEVDVVYFEPESTHGVAREATAHFKLKAIVAIEDGADDRDLTPELKGVTDQLSIADWDPPFPFDERRVGKEDEAYWKKYRATPKAFINLHEGQRLWSSRFGNTTSLRIAPNPRTDTTPPADDWQPRPLEMGFEFRPVKRLAVAASSGTTPFDGLFLGFSFFLIAAAVMLVVILFRLAIERRASEAGILLAIGFTTRRLRRAMLCEGAIVAALGALLGVLGGIAYAWLMLVGLSTWWLAAIGTPFLTLYVTSGSLIAGYLGGVVISLLAIAWSVWRMREASVRQLLAGQLTRSGGGVASGEFDAEVPPGAVWWTNLRSLVARYSYLLPLAALGGAIVAAFAGGRLSGMEQAGAFFGSGASALVATMALVWNRLASGATGAVVAIGQHAIPRLALRNAARNPLRSTLTIGLVAAASFLLVAISAFHLDRPQPGQRHSGTGGFQLVAMSDQPILQDLNTPEGRAELNFLPDDEQTLEGTQFYACRLQTGDDASCLNLYQTSQPQVLGVSQALVERDGFAFASSSAKPGENPWQALSEPARDESGLPVVFDAATATYSLHLGGVGSRFDLEIGGGKEQPLKVAGLLANSMLQGMAIVGEQDFVDMFPDVAGYRFFLIDCPAERREAVARVLEQTLGDQGFDAEPAGDRLAGFLAVQNTYLSTFQALGGLGLLLGTFGLAAVQLRSVLERRGELALLRACGFSRELLADLVLWESAVLLAIGLAAGVLTALVAIAPQLHAGAAAIPWISLGLVLALVLVTGLLTSLVAVRAVVAAPLLPALRGE